MRPHLILELNYEELSFPWFPSTRSDLLSLHTFKPPKSNNNPQRHLSSLHFHILDDDQILIINSGYHVLVYFHKSVKKNDGVPPFMMIGT